MADFIEQLGGVLSSLGTWGYLLVALVVLLETLIAVGQFLPGSVFLAFVGFLCYLQVFDLGTMSAVIFFAHYLGEAANYTVGARKGRAFFSENALILKKSLLDAVDAQLRKWGPIYFVLCQFSGVLRPVLSFLAGAAHYPHVRFALWMIPASALWTAVHLGAGFLLGAGWRQAGAYIENFSLILVVAVVCLAIAVWITRTALALTGLAGRWLEQTGRRVVASSFYQQCRMRSPTVFHFLERRLSLSAPWGWSATVRFSLAALTLLAALILGVIATHSTTLSYFDAAVANLLAQVRQPLGGNFLLVLSTLSEPAWLLGSAAVLSLIALGFGGQRTALLLSSSPALASCLDAGLKLLFERERPEVAAVFHTSGFAYPSNHAATASALLLATIVWVWRTSSDRRIRILWGSAVATLLLLIAYSRIYLGLHYLSDVAGGMLVGTASAIVGATLSAHVSWPERMPKTMAITLSAACLVVLGLAAILRLHFSPEIVASFRPAALECEKEVRGLDEALPLLPRTATRLTGEPSLAIDLVVVGDAARFVDALQQAGWRMVLPHAFYTREVQAPIFPAFVNALPALYTLETHNGARRQILRLWPAGICVNGQPVWVASLIDEKLRRRFLAMQIYSVDPDIDLAIERWCAAAAPCPCRMIEGFRERGLHRSKHLFFTHGAVAVVSADCFTSTTTPTVSHDE